MCIESDKKCLHWCCWEHSGEKSLNYFCFVFCFLHSAFWTHHDSCVFSARAAETLRCECVAWPGITLFWNHPTSCFIYLCPLYSRFYLWIFKKHAKYIWSRNFVLCLPVSDCEILKLRYFVFCTVTQIGELKKY